MRISDWSPDVCSSDLGNCKCLRRSRPRRNVLRSSNCFASIYRHFECRAFRKRPNLSSENLSFFGRFEGAARFRGQSLTVDSVADSRLAFGGSLGRGDRGYRRRRGSDRSEEGGGGKEGGR